MLLKYFSLTLLLAQCLLAAPTPDGATSPNSSDATQKQLEKDAQAETVTLLNSLFRSQIAYLNGVKEKLAPTTQRARDLDVVISRLNEAIATQGLDQKNTMWHSIFEQFRKSKLLINNEAETGLTDQEYTPILTDQKLQEITKSFVNDVSRYLWKIAQLSGKVVQFSIEDYFGQINSSSSSRRQ